MMSEIGKSVSVVIVTKGISSTIHDAITSVLKCEPLEVIVVSRVEVDDLRNIGSLKVRVAPDLSISGARNLGISISVGDIVAFTDDDCTVSEDWFANALAHFTDESVAVVGGPGVTHPDDPIMAKCAGAVLASRVGTFSSSARYAGKRRHAGEAGEQELSTCNLFFRRTTLQAVGYFDDALYPCEENELIERIRSSGYKCVYTPSCIVYHHRRPLFRPFLKQIRSYAYGRAVFTLSKPGEFRPVVATPSILVLATLLLPISYFQSPTLAIVLGLSFTTYLFVCLVGAIETTLSSGLSIGYAVAVWLGIVAMHYWYGGSFLLGLGKVLSGWPR